MEQGWRLLRNYLTKFTSVNVPIYHKAVATKLLSLGCNLPIWFVNDYKRRNPGQLLRIYTSYDLLEEAGELAIEYINAVLGIGKESFGIEVGFSQYIYVFFTFICIRDFLNIERIVCFPDIKQIFLQSL